MTVTALAENTVLIATPLPNGTQVLVPRAVRIRSYHRLDGKAKISHGHSLSGPSTLR